MAFGRHFKESKNGVNGKRERKRERRNVTCRNRQEEDKGGEESQVGVKREKPEQKFEKNRVIEKCFTRATGFLKEGLPLI